MLGKSRGSNVEMEYSDEQIYGVLAEWYDTENCIRLDEFLYIVREEDIYYLMKQSIPEIFFTDDALELKNVIDVTTTKDAVSIKIQKEEGHIILTHSPKKRFISTHLPQLV